MKKIKSELKFCIHCMEEHEVDIVKIKDSEIFKDEEVNFDAIYQYCPMEDELLETEEMMRINSLAMKDAYREKMNLLTSKEIIEIRKRYEVSQKDFSEILDWGRATITRYENHQVQDRGNDNVLRKIESDPKWFLEMLRKSKEKLSDKAFNKYYKKANGEFKKKRNQYLTDSIKSLYANYEDKLSNGGVELNLTKLVEMINYLASKVESLHKVKLAKMLWFSDNLHYKKNGIGISGLVYSALPKGAVPEGYDEIILLDGIQFETVLYGENIGYKFKTSPSFEIKELSELEIETLDYIITHLGDFNTDEIVHKMHEEEAYKCTGSNCIISYNFAKELTID